MIDITELLYKVCIITKKAGKMIKDENDPDIFVKEGRANFVTSMDIAVQNYLIASLKEILPQSNFFAEENKSNQLLPGYNWIIDPIDGTANYMMGFNHSCISIALEKDGDVILGVVYDPFCNELFSAEKGKGAFLNGRPIKAPRRPVDTAVIVFGTAMYYRELADLTFNSARAIFELCGDIRRTGSAALDLCYVASGKCDAYYELRIQPWDYAAGMLIAREAGAEVLGLLDKPLDLVSPVGILAGSHELCTLIDNAVKEQAAILGSK